MKDDEFQAAEANNSGAISVGDRAAVYDPRLAAGGTIDVGPIYATAAASTPFGITSVTATDQDFGSWLTGGDTLTLTDADRALTAMANSGSIVASAIGEAAQAIIQPDVPLALVDELLATVQGQSVQDVLKARVRMVLDDGTAEDDDMLPIGVLPNLAEDKIKAGRAALFEKSATRLQNARALLVEGLAIGLAAVDRLDRAIKAQGR